MAELVLIDPFISLGGTDLSEHFKSVSLGPTVDTQDSTAFGDEWTEMEPGLKEFSVTMDFNQDFAVGGFRRPYVAALRDKGRPRGSRR